MVQAKELDHERYVGTTVREALTNAETCMFRSVDGSSALVQKAVTVQARGLLGHIFFGKHFETQGNLKFFAGWESVA